MTSHFIQPTYSEFLVNSTRGYLLFRERRIGKISTGKVKFIDSSISYGYDWIDEKLVPEFLFSLGIVILDKEYHLVSQEQWEEACFRSKGIDINAR